MADIYLRRHRGIEAEVWPDALGPSPTKRQREPSGGVCGQGGRLRSLRPSHGTAVLTAEGLLSARGRPFSGGEVHVLRKRWQIPTVKINGTGHNPPQWPDGTYSVQGAAAALSISTQTVFKWLEKGRLLGHQLAKGMPWQIPLSTPQITTLKTQVRRTNQSKKEAS